MACQSENCDNKTLEGRPFCIPCGNRMDSKGTCHICKIPGSVKVGSCCPVCIEKIRGTGICIMCFSPIYEQEVTCDSICETFRLL